MKMPVETNAFISAASSNSRMLRGDALLLEPLGQLTPHGSCAKSGNERLRSSRQAEWQRWQEPCRRN